MSQRQPNVAQSVYVPARGHAKQITDTYRQTDLTLDLIIIETGLRLKVLPLHDAIIRGRKLSFSEAERRARQRALFEICGNAQASIVDIGLFADAVARRPEVAQRLWRALRSHTPRQTHGIGPGGQKKVAEG